MFIALGVLPVVWGESGNVLMRLGYDPTEYEVSDGRVVGVVISNL